MTRAVRIMLAAASAVLFLLMPAPAAHACSCTGATLAEHLQNATVAFVGRAEDSKDAPEGVVTRFRVISVYKGPIARQLEVTTEENEAACGVPFVEGRSYVVFAHSQFGPLVTSLCSGTTDDLATVDGLMPLVAPPSHSPRSASDLRPSGAYRGATIAVAALLIALVSAAATLAVRASRRPRPIS